MAEVLAFLGVCALVICTPGPDTALTIRNSIIGGRRGGLLTAGGIAAGQLTWTIAASVGLAGLLQASQPAFTALKIIGAAYWCFSERSRSWLGFAAIPLMMSRSWARTTCPHRAQCAKG